MDWAHSGERREADHVSEHDGCESPLASGQPWGRVSSPCGGNAVCSGRANSALPESGIHYGGLKPEGGPLDGASGSGGERGQGGSFDHSVQNLGFLLEA